MENSHFLLESALNNIFGGGGECGAEELFYCEEQMLFELFG